MFQVGTPVSARSPRDPHASAERARPRARGAPAGGAPAARRAATDALHRAAAGALVAGVMSDADIRALRAVLKHAGAARMNALAAEYRTRTAAGQHAPPPASPAVPSPALREFVPRGGGTPAGRAAAPQHAPVGDERPATTCPADDPAEGAAGAACERTTERADASTGARANAARPAGARRASPRRTAKRSVLAAVPTAAEAAVGVRPVAPARGLTLAELADDPRLDEVGNRRKLVRAMAAGASAREALRDSGFDETRVRWAQKLFAKCKAGGGLLDGRWTRQPARLVMTDEMQARVLRAWNGRKKANKRAIWRMVRDGIRTLRAEAEAAGRSVDHLVEPGYDAVYKYLRSLPRPLRLAHDEGVAAWDKQGRPFIDYNPAERPNHIWQIDHTRLDIWIRTEVAPGVWEVRQVYLTAVLDVYSRAVMGYVLSTKVPDAWTTALALRAAILPRDDPAWPMRGLPQILVPDHGKDFMAGDTKRLTNALGIHLDPTPPYYPDMKAQIERLFGTIHSYLSELVGYMPADGRSVGAAVKRIPMLLTLPRLREELERVLADYHQRPHTGIGGEAPAGRWRATARPELPESEEELNVLLLKDDTVRTVTKEGIRFTAKTRVTVPCDATTTGEDAEERVEVRGGRYWAPDLMDYWKQEVRIRYNPEDPESVLVYHAATGEYLCEAWLMGYATSKYGPIQIKHLRAGYRKGLKERTTDYAKEVERDDRRSARAHDEAAAVARQLEAQRAAKADDSRDYGPAPVAPSSPRAAAAARPRREDADVVDLVAALERQARGKSA